MKKYIGNFLSSVSFLLSIVVLILYFITLNQTTSALSESIFYIFIIISIAMLILNNFITDFKGAISITSCCFLLASLGVFINSQLSNIGYYAHGVHDIGDGILPTFIVGMVIGIICLIINIILVFIEPNNVISSIKNK